MKCPKFASYTGALLLFTILSSNVLQGALVLGSGTTNSDDHDSDGVGFLVDNAPSISNPGQEDSDFDGIGNVIDPNPTVADIYAIAVISAPSTITVPVGGDLAFSLFAASPLLTPSLIQFDFTFTFSGVEAYESVFTDLTNPALIVIPASFFTDGSNWDLNTEGSYTLGVTMAEVPGVSGSNTAIININVIPEPSTGLLVVFATASTIILGGRTRRRSQHLPRREFNPS